MDNAPSTLSIVSGSCSQLLGPPYCFLSLSFPLISRRTTSSSSTRTHGRILVHTGTACRTFPKPLTSPFFLRLFLQILTLASAILLDLLRVRKHGSTSPCILFFFSPLGANHAFENYASRIELSGFYSSSCRLIGSLVDSSGIPVTSNSVPLVFHQAFDPLN